MRFSFWLWQLDILSYNYKLYKQSFKNGQQRATSTVPELSGLSRPPDKSAHCFTYIFLSLFLLHLVQPRAIHHLKWTLLYTKHTKQDSKLIILNKNTKIKKVIIQNTMTHIGFRTSQTYVVGSQKNRLREHSGSVVECLTRYRETAGSSLTGVTALWSLNKTHLP